MPYFILQKPIGTTNWKFSNRLDNYVQACMARDNHAKVSADVVVRMVKANTEGEARGKGGVVWNSLANDPNR